MSNTAPGPGCADLAAPARAPPELEPACAACGGLPKEWCQLPEHHVGSHLRALYRIDNVRHPEVVAALEAAEHLPFGTDEHFRLWSAQAEHMRQLLTGLGLFEKTIVLQVPWALITVEGSPTPWSMGTSAKDANAAYLRYYERLRELGFTLIELQPLSVLADPEHRWGLAPFHYVQDVYEEIAQRVLTHLGEQGSDATSSGQD